MSLKKTGTQLVAEGAAAFFADMAKAGDAVTAFGAAADSAAKGVGTFGTVATGALLRVGEVAVDVMGQAAQAFGAFVADSVSAAGDFEAGINKLGAVAGDSVAEAGFSLDDLRQKALQLGADTQFSADQALDAMTNLAKGGVPVADIMGAATAATLNLAAAGGVELGAAGDIVAKTLGVWARTGLDATTATDLLAQAANASTVEVQELADGAANAQGRAQGMGVAYKDFITTMALIAPAFSSSQEAGSSYNNFLARLLPTTKDQIAAFKELGLMTAEGANKFFDSTGAFIGNRAAAELLQNALGDLSAEQKSSYLNTIFGSDAMGAASALIAEGAEGYDRVTVNMGKAGTAAEQAAKMNQGYKAAFDALLGSVDTFKITLGSALLPLLSSLITSYLIPGVNAVTDLAAAFSAFAGGDSFTAFTTLAGVLQPISPALAAFASELALASDPMATLVGAINSVIPGFSAFVGFVGSIPAYLSAAAAALAPFAEPLAGLLVPALVGLAAVMGGAVIVAVGSFVATMAAAAAPVLALAAVAGVLYAAWQTNFGGIQGIVAGALSGIAGIVSSVMTTVVGFWTTYGAQILTTTQTTWGSIQTTIGGLVQGITAVVQPVLAQLSAFWAANGAEIQATVAEVWTGIGGVIQATMGLINATVVPALGAIGGFITAHSADIQAVLSGAWQAIAGIITTSLSTIQGLIQTVTQAIQGDWTGAWTTLQNTSATMVQGIANVIADVLSTIPGIISLVMGDAGAVLQGYIGKFRSIGADLIGGVIKGVKSGAGELMSAMRSLAMDALQSAKDALGISSPSAVAAKQVGVPFVEGIVTGIANSLDMIKGMARHLSKQLTEDMEKVAKEAANAFKAVLQSELEADAGFAGTRLDIFRKLRDLASGSKTSDAEQNITEAEARLKAGQDKQTDADAAYEAKASGLEADARKNEEDRRAALAKLDREREARGISVDDPTYQQEVLDINLKYDRSLGEINGKLLEARAAYDEQTQAITEQVAQLQQALDIARARLLLEKELDERRGAMVKQTQADLEQAAKEAEKIRTFDPAAADAYYRLRSKQILDLADLEQQRLEALRQSATTGSVEDRDALQSFDTERALLEAQQVAERTLFAANAKANSPFAGLAESVKTLQDKLTAELQRDQGMFNLTDRNNVKMRDRIANEIAQDQAAINQINGLLEQIGAAAMGGGVAGVEGGAPALIAAIQAAFAEAQRATEATLGISSPSKVFANEVGLPVAQGIAVGIAKGQKDISSALAMSVSPPTATTVRPAMSASQQASYSTTNTTGFSFGDFNGAGVTPAQVKAIVTEALNRSGRTAYTRRATA